MGFVILVICCMLQVTEHLTIALEELRVGKPQSGSMEALIFYRKITLKPLPFRKNVTVLSHQFL